MKKQLLKIMIPALSMAVAGAASAQTVRLASEGAYAPFNYMDDSGTLAGFEIDLGNALCERAELDCEWVQNEWDSMIPNLVAGNYDGILAGMTITEERLQTIDFSDEYFPPDPSKFVVLKGTPLDTSALSGLKIGVQGGTIQAAYAEETYGADNDILSFETGDQAIADLAAGNVDVVLADGGFVDPVIEGSQGAIVLAGDEVLIGGGMGVGMRKDDDALEAAFNAALASMKADGSLDALIQEYFNRGPFYAD
ncbi:transporter substrate-binding domain-containing protein [Granulosicoccaceae sp. 1_MG-2023]|nr:transporter substrate-binding domain-containing protein [Granulosicoccaceae sp. 1_MG-2023]